MRKKKAYSAVEINGSEETGKDDWSFSRDKVINDSLTVKYWFSGSNIFVVFSRLKKDKFGTERSY